MNTYGIDLMGRRRRRRHSAEFKAAVIQECMRPGVSIAAVALAHSLNANMLRKWVIEGMKAPSVRGAVQRILGRAVTRITPHMRARVSV
jgi:transposase-like protein